MESEIAGHFQQPPPSGGDAPEKKPLAPGASDRYMLEGPRARTSEMGTLLSIMRDFLRGFRVLHFVGPCVTAFGSARTKEDSPYYQLARAMGGAITKLGFTVMTGAGPGIMEAANRGAKEAGGRGGGWKNEIPLQQAPNNHPPPRG